MSDYRGPERRRAPDDHELVRVVRDEIKYQIETQNQFIDRRFSQIEDGQRSLKESHITLRGKQEEFQREIDGWKAGARWVNITAITLAAILAALAKAWDWVTSHQ